MKGVPRSVRPLMSKRFSISILLVAALAATPLAHADSKVSGSLAKVLKEVSARQKKVDTLQADFRQEKELALLAKPEVSTGTFVYAKPSDVLWRYDAPKPVVMLISKGWLTTYYPQLNKAEKLEVKRYQDRIFRYMAASGAIDDLGKYFDFKFIESKASPSYLLELNPKTKTLAKRVQKIRIWIDKTSYLTTKFEYVEGDGDITRYEFTNIRLNKPVPAASFELKLPAGVRIEQMKVN
jgi:outer membrane lipoprotein-sorting protein